MQHSYINLKRCTKLVRQLDGHIIRASCGRQKGLYIICINPKISKRDDNHTMLWTLHFSRVFPLNDNTRFYLFGEKYDLLEKSWSRHLLLLLFLREYRIRKKTLSMTPYLEKTVYGKPKSSSGVRLPIRKVR